MVACSLLRDYGVVEKTKKFNKCPIYIFLGKSLKVKILRKRKKTLLLPRGGGTGEAGEATASLHRNSEVLLQRNF